jgi:hypothetical protein
LSQLFVLQRVSAGDRGLLSLLFWRITLQIGAFWQGRRAGALSFIDGMGLKAFVARAKELAAKYGPQFEPGEKLIQMAEPPQSAVLLGRPLLIQRSHSTAAHPALAKQGARATGCFEEIVRRVD